jgi:cysteine desulfurase
LCYGARMPQIYLDHNATSPLCPESREAMLRVMAEGPWNPSSPHACGRAARRVVESAREDVAQLIGASPEDVVLTSGGTESNNLAIYGASGLFAGTARHFVTSAIEHPSVLAPIEDLERRGMDVTRVRPTRDGVVEAAAVLEAVSEGTALASLMLANNEIGTIQPVAEIGEPLAARGVLLHCDASQAVGKIPVDVRNLAVDLLTVAGHKFGAPQGVGALFVRRGLALRPHLRGGGQELNRRPGTENVVAIAGLGAAAAAAQRTLSEREGRIAELRALLEGEVLGRVPGSSVNGGASPRVPNTSSLAFEGVAAEALVFALDLEGIVVSSGAACSSGTIRRSHVLLAMGRVDEAGASIRVSLGASSTREEIMTFVETLERLVERVRSAAAREAGRVGQ